jgi:2,3-bisphosphoglycerate-independent phosphoglycerate mutase
VVRSGFLLKFLVDYKQAQFYLLIEECVIAVLPDHPTPIKVGTYTRDTVPFAIYNPSIEADGVKQLMSSLPRRAVLA